MSEIAMEIKKSAKCLILSWHQNNLLIMCIRGREVLIYHYTLLAAKSNSDSALMINGLEIQPNLLVTFCCHHFDYPVHILEVLDKGTKQWKLLRLMLLCITLIAYICIILYL